MNEPSESREKEPTPLRDTAAWGVKWTSVSSVIIVGVQAVQLAVLARLLNPGDFGLAAIIMVVIGFATIFGDMGISNAIIAKQTTNRECLSSLYWANFLAGATVCGLVLASTPLIVGFYDEPRLSSLMPLAAVVFLIMPVGQQFQVLLQKDLQFAILARIDMASAIIGAIGAIATAVFGAGAAALIWGLLTTVVAKAILLAHRGWASWRPMLRLRRDDLRGYLWFGFYQMGERSANYFSANIDYILVGRFLGADVLGVYTLAYQLVVMPLLRLNPVLTRVAFPIFSKRRTDNAVIRTGFIEIIRLIAFIVFPILMGLAILAPHLVPVVFGAGWEGSVPLIQILALVGAVKALTNPIGSVLLAKNRPDIGFILNIGVLVVLTAAFLLVIQYGIIAVSWIYVAVSVAYLPIAYKVLKSIISLSLNSYVQALLRPVFLTLAMGSAILLAHFVLINSISNQGVLLTFLVLVGLAAYAVLVAFFDSRYVRGLWDLFISSRESPT